jgi:hypothetical protein
VPAPKIGPNHQFCSSDLGETFLCKEDGANQRVPSGCPRRPPEEAPQDGVSERKPSPLLPQTAQPLPLRKARPEDERSGPSQNRPASVRHPKSRCVVRDAPARRLASLVTDTRPNTHNPRIPTASSNHRGASAGLRHKNTLLRINSRRTNKKST